MATERFQKGTGLVYWYWYAVVTAAHEHQVWSDLIGAIVAHESQAKERKVARVAIGALVGIGSVVLGDTADLAERAEVKLRGDSASIGVAQMQVGLAKRLRSKYPSIVDGGVVDDLLSPPVAIRYVAAAIRELRDNLDAFLKKYGVTLTEEERKDLIAVGYNIGWEALRDRNLSASDMGDNIPQRVAKVRRTSTYIKATIAQWRELSR